MREEEARNRLLQMAFQAHAEPARFNAADLDHLATMFRSPSLDGELLHQAGQVMNFLITSPLGQSAIDGLLTLLRETTHSPTVYETLVQSLRYAAGWRRPMLEADELVRLATLDHLRQHRGFLEEEILEPCLFGAPATVTGEQLAHASPWCRHYLGKAVEFPLHGEVARGLRNGPRRVLVVHNIADGQGDEILRCVPLLQALLDFNPQLKITLLAKRAYLYSHPRLTVADIRHPFLFQPPYDAIADFFENNILDLNHDIGVEARLQALIRRHPPFLLVCSSKRHNHFVFDRLEIAGRSLAETLGLNKRRVPKNYETAFRLIAELGLPLRTGENPPLSEPVLAGIPWPEADRAWEELTTANTDRRPVALLLPYGGSEPLKGHTRPEDVAAEIHRLIELGFFVVLTTSSEPWGSAERADEALDHLSAGDLSRVAVAPGPSSAQDRDNHGRMLLYHIRAANRIVAVEGWMIHAAWCLGKPYEILMCAYSHSDEWLPYAATYQQEVTQTPQQPGKFARMFWLEETRDPDSLALLRAALVEPDRDIRAAAARGLGHRPFAEAGTSLTERLDDPAPPVRAAAAEALLQYHDGEHSRELLQAHVFIGRRPPDWAAVLGLGAAARPALEVAARSDDPVIRREAVHMLGLLGRAAVRSGARAPRRSVWRRGLSFLFPRRESTEPKILILTPVKDAAGCIPGYAERLLQITYPHSLISVGLLESDSADTTFGDLKQILPMLNREFRRTGLWKRDFGYQLPPGRPRWDEEVQVARRTVLARSRNHLLSRALKDEDWVLWLDVDVIEYPADILQQLLRTGKDIVHPHCVKIFGGPSFDRNAWRDQGRLHLDDLRAEGPLVKLDAVGGTMLLVRADLHREGLIFPPFPYGRPNPRIRLGTPELETEGLGLMAQDMGYQCWGMPYLEIRHRDQ